ncbi:hypothetical protein RUM43_002548 [Polyplax serrata]|uniref:tRNA-splicing endonuclease subunit Sen15 domain-containing protein n=1 Tax=Polyplax serrata TaxID=468196 RepID=A0AAN8S4U7_POLSC
MSLNELLQICTAQNVQEGQAHLAFQAFMELSEGQKLHDLQYEFNKTLKKFYLLGKKEKFSAHSDIYVPVLFEEELSPEDLNNWIEILSPVHKKFNLHIRDRDSSSTCYKITQGLIKPNSPNESKELKSKEIEMYEMERCIYKNKKKLYMKALKNS